MAVISVARISVSRLMDAWISFSNRESFTHLLLIFLWISSQRRKEGGRRGGEEIRFMMWIKSFWYLMDHQLPWHRDGARLIDMIFACCLYGHSTRSFIVWSHQHNEWGVAKQRLEAGKQLLQATHDGCSWTASAGCLVGGIVISVHLGSYSISPWLASASAATVSKFAHSKYSPGCLSFC